MNNFKDFTKSYFDRMQDAAAQIDPVVFEKVKDVFAKAYKEGRRFYVCGNGGSAAISDHFICDANKGTHVEGKRPLMSQSLASNGPMITALANDISYEQVFSKQLEYLLEPGDVVVTISSSGNSPNVVRACEYAKSKGAVTVAFVGFEGGKLHKLADYSLWVPIKNYGIAEDLHQSIMHILTQFLYQEIREGRL